jgi:hypothetical protein
MTRYDRLQKRIQRLSLADKQALQTWLSEEIEQERQPPAVKPVSRREVVETALIIRASWSDAVSLSAVVRLRAAYLAPTGMATARKKGDLRAGTLAKN